MEQQVLPTLQHKRAMRRKNLLFLLFILTTGAIGYWLLLTLFDRTSEFQAQAEAGQPIVRAIDDYHKQTGHWPESLAALVPKYLPAVPDMPDESKRKFIGWDYCVVTNRTVVSYRLRYYLGRGGVEYEPPNWIRNEEGSKKFILRNQ